MISDVVLVLFEYTCRAPTRPMAQMDEDALTEDILDDDDLDFDKATKDGFRAAVAELKKG